MASTTKKVSKKELVVLSSMIFGMFFGSGNLIFPVHLGQLAGSHWLSASLGFAVSGALFPLLAILAVVVTNSDGLYDLARPVGRKYAALFLVLVHLTIGPFFGTPRTAATAFEIGLKPFLPTQYLTVGLLLFTAVFFGLAYFLTLHQNKLITYVGKYLNSIFLVLLAVVFLIAFFKPMGALHQQPTTAYVSHALTNGVLQGYNTVDAVALLALSITFVHAVKALGFKKDAARVTAKAGTLSVLLEVVIYFGLVLVGAMSLNHFKLSDNGGVALAQIVRYYLSDFGGVFLGVLVTVGVFTTAMGLLVSFAQDFHKLFPKVSYKNWLRVTTVVSFVVANAGLDNIIQWSLPVLMLLYPLSLALILLSLTHKYFEKNQRVYQLTIALTAVPAVLDMLANAPKVVATQPVVANVLAAYHHYVPFAALGLGWVLPTLVGFGLGLVLYKFNSAPVHELQVEKH